MTEKGVKKKRINVPHTYVLLFIVIVFAAVLTYLIPSGVFERVADPDTGRMIIDVDSFKFVESSPVSFLDIFNGIHKGMANGSNIIFFIFILAGSFEIIQSTGVIDAGISKVLKTFSKQKELLVILIVLIFSVAGGTIGLAEEVIVFIPIMISLFSRLGYDKMVGAVVVMVGSRIGFVAGLMNPFTVGVAQGIAELPLFSGLGYRLIWYGVLLVMSLVYIMKYVRKVENDLTSSILYGHEDDMIEDNKAAEELQEFTKSHLLVLAVVVLGFGVMIYGVVAQGWYMTEIAGIFLATGIISGLVGRLAPNIIAERFVAGAKEMTFGAIVVGVASAVLVMLEEGQIIDSIIYYAGMSLQKLPKVLAAVGMFIFQLVLNIFIPSGSGQAAATMPIMAPLADVLGITRQTAVTAFHYGDGFTNLVSPTNGTLMASLAVAGISYEKWMKWMMPLFWGWVFVGMISVAISAIVGIGPF